MRVTTGESRIAFVGHDYIRIDKFPNTYIPKDRLTVRNRSGTWALSIYENEQEYEEANERARMVQKIKKYDFSKRTLQDIKFIYNCIAE